MFANSSMTSTTPRYWQETWISSLWGWKLNDLNEGIQRPVYASTAGSAQRDSDPACKLRYCSWKVTVSLSPLLDQCTTTTSHWHSPNLKYDTWITWARDSKIIKTNILIRVIPLLGQHTTTTSHSLKWTCITWGIIKFQVSSSFFEGFLIIEGQSHSDPHQNYCWCDALGIMSSIKQ